MITSKTSLHRRLSSLCSPESCLRCIRWALALIFIYSGARKLVEPLDFAQVIAGFGLLPASLIIPTALLLPLAEVFAGIGLLFNKRGSLTVIALMLVMFMAVLAYGIHLGLDIECGCFGPEDPEQAYKGLKAALVRDAVFLVAVICLYGLKHKEKAACCRS